MFDLLRTHLPQQMQSNLDEPDGWVTKSSPDAANHALPLASPPASPAASPLQPHRQPRHQLLLESRVLRRYGDTPPCAVNPSASIGHNVVPPALSPSPSTPPRPPPNIRPPGRALTPLMLGGGRQKIKNSVLLLGLSRWVVLFASLSVALHLSAHSVSLEKMFRCEHRQHGTARGC